MVKLFVEVMLTEMDPLDKQGVLFEDDIINMGDSFVVEIFGSGEEYAWSERDGISHVEADNQEQSPQQIVPIDVEIENIGANDVEGFGGDLREDEVMNDQVLKDVGRENQPPTSSEVEEQADENANQNVFANIKLQQNDVPNAM